MVDDVIEEEDEEKEEQEDDGKKKKKEKKKKKKNGKYPHWVIYIAYVVVGFASLVSATFTVFYGLTFGAAKSQKWIMTMMISFWQDVLVSQPLKVFAAATFFALVIKNPDKVKEIYKKGRGWKGKQRVARQRNAKKEGNLEGRDGMRCDGKGREWKGWNGMGWDWMGKEREWKGSVYRLYTLVFVVVDIHHSDCFPARG